MNGGGSERGRHRIWNRLQAPSCQHGAWREARTHGPRDHDLSRSRPLNRQSHPVCLFLRERERERQRETERETERERDRWGREGERRRHRIRSRLQALTCQHRVRLEPTNHETMTWAEVRHLTDWATQAPQNNCVWCTVCTFSLIQPWWASFCLHYYTDVSSYILMRIPVSFLFLLPEACIVDGPFLRPFSPDFQDMLVSLLVKTFTCWSPPALASFFFITVLTLFSKGWGSSSFVDWVIAFSPMSESLFQDPVLSANPVSICCLITTHPRLTIQSA